VAAERTGVFLEGRYHDERHRGEWRDITTRGRRKIRTATACRTT
jgi:hypothetical protein